MIGTIGSIGSNIYQNYRELQITNHTTSQALSFDELLSNGTIKTKDEPSLGIDGITATPQTETNSTENTTITSNCSDNEMDLNKDGQVTPDEIVRYVQMQMLDRLSEDICSDEGITQMNQQTQAQDGFDNLKNKLAKTAYKIGDSLLETATSYSFLL